MQLEENVRVAIRGLIDHKFRSLLTMLGIIFGVASVIAMISIGEGAKKQAIAKYKDLGVNNIIITIANGIVAPIIHGTLRPHLLFVRSERYPIIGSLNAFQILQKTNAKLTSKTGSLTTVK